ncbi:hypothetical protein [Staphylococcus aureus]|nr:hypothetical protein [Staphylococcus aureus]MCR0868887.1 hypothetical protein [Staphylococcus aureus]MCS5351897.1 hypothetical protein [Staphylococcus aureus]
MAEVTDNTKVVSEGYSRETTVNYDYVAKQRTGLFICTFSYYENDKAIR